MRLFKDANFQFIQRKNYYFAFSIFVTLISMVSLIAHRGPKFGIDFKGGSLLQVQFKEKPDVPKIRSVFDQYPEFGSVEIKQYGDEKDHEVIIGVQHQTEIGSTVDKVAKVLDKDFTGAYTIRREEAVGPKIGDELKWKALWSVLLSFLAITIYLWFRFELAWGVAAIIALIHDVFITLGVFSLFNLEVDLPVIAAFLTIIGFSINDTIVIFDRIRENFVLEKNLTVKEVVNKSINQTLSRTIMTSFTVILAVFSLYLIGVSVIKNIAFAFTVGVIFGTYSSVGVAGALLVTWPERWIRRHKRV